MKYDDSINCFDILKGTATTYIKKKMWYDCQ